MRDQQATPEELDGRAHWESHEALIFQLQSALLVTSVLAVGRKVKNQIRTYVQSDPDFSWREAVVRPFMEGYI